MTEDLVYLRRSIVSPEHNLFGSKAKKSSFKAKYFKFSHTYSSSLRRNKHFLNTSAPYNITVCSVFQSVTCTENLKNVSNVAGYLRWVRVLPVSPSPPGRKPEHVRTCFWSSRADRSSPKLFSILGL